MAVATLCLATLQSAGSAVWCPPGVADDADSHAAFRASFVSSGGKLQLDLLGASAYLAYLDGKLVADGPSRFARDYPETLHLGLDLAAGKHTIAVHVHNVGVSTRLLDVMPPFLWCTGIDKGKPISFSWKCARIPGFTPRARRISNILGWIDWVDTRQTWADWEQPGFDDSKWTGAVSRELKFRYLRSGNTGPVRSTPVALKPLAKGKLTENFGYEGDDPAARFFLRDLDPKKLPPQGVWRRYDLGRVRLGRARMTLDVPRGAVVEFASSEQLRHDRVSAWITLSTSMTCNLDHFVARGGPQTFMPFTPKGGRFLEVHVLTAGPVKFLNEEFLDRGYFGEPDGAFECSDPLLNMIWMTGVNTLRACAEDGIIDNASRERGQWTGDVVSVATDVAAAAYTDIRLPRRALVQAAQAARADGLVAGLGPSDPVYLSTYAAQWVSACMHYWEITGDKTLLTEVFDAAEKNLAAFRANLVDGGVSDNLGWAFVDWGYVRNSGPSDMGLNVHYLLALRDMEKWCVALKKTEKAASYRDEAHFLELGIRAWLAEQRGSWPRVGYHRATLALLAHLVDEKEVPNCIAYIKRHLLAAFPNNPDAPRLSDPSVANEQLMTPYFCHYAFNALLQRGEIGFVLGQYRKCWGWALQEGQTTWMEVFDPRWSQCHAWSGCPTWQLSRFVLGFRPRFQDGDVFDVNILTGDLKFASGKIPLRHDGAMSVGWTRIPGGVHLKVETPIPVILRFGNREVRVAKKFEGDLQDLAGRMSLR